MSMSENSVQAQWDAYADACLDHDPDAPCVTHAAELTLEGP